MTRSAGLAWMGPEKLELLSREIASVAAGEVLLQIESCAICGSDLRILKEGNARISAGRIIGHEIAGTIVEIGKAVTRFRVGDRVAVGADVPCGECEFCTSGRSNCCRINYAIGYQFDGGFAQFMTVPEIVVRQGPIHKFSKNVSFDLAAMAEPLGCCINGYEIALADRLFPKTVIIFGAGPIGLLLATLAPQYGVQKVIVIDPSDERLAFARTVPEVSNTLSTSSESLIDEVLALTGGEGGDLIFTACPDVRSHSQAIQMLAVRGVLNLFGGVTKNSAPLAIDSNFIHYREAYITGSHGSTPAQHRRALEMIENGQVDLQKFISKKFSLSDYQSAFALAASKSAMKVIIAPNV